MKIDYVINIIKYDILCDIMVEEHGFQGEKNMNNQNTTYEKVMSTNDTVKLLSLRVPFEFEGLNEHQRKKILIFKETVDLLVRIESFISDIKANTAPTSEEYAEAVKSQNQTEINRMCTYFSRLRHHKGLVSGLGQSMAAHESYVIFGSKYSLRESLSSYGLRVLCYDDGDDDSMERYIKHANATNFTLIGDPFRPNYKWTAEEFPHEKCFDIINKIRLELESNSTSQQKKETEFLKAINDEYQKFDRLLEQYSTVYTLSLDVRFIHDYNCRAVINYDQFIKESLGKIEKLKKVIKCLPFLLHALFKIESDYQFGLNVHTILIFKNKIKFDKAEIIQILQIRLIDALNGDKNIEIKNWSDVLSVHRSKTAIGIIKKDNLRQVEEFKYWHLSYFFCIDQYLKLQYYDEQDNEQPINDFFWGHTDNDFIWEHPQKNYTPILFQTLLLDKDEKLIWQLKHLPKEVKHRLAIAQLFYNETHHQNFNIANFPVSLLLYQIEVFIESLLHSPVLAFNFPLNVSLTEKELANSATRLGKQFLSLCMRGWQLIVCNADTQKMSNLSLGTKYFFDSSIYSICTKRYVPTQIIDRQQMEFLNAALAEFRKSFNDHKKLRTGETGQKSLAEYMQYKYNVCQTRQRNAVVYVKQLFQQDCVLFRVQLRCTLQAGRLTQSQFSKLLTMFIRFGRRAKPLSWMYGYIGIWQEDAALNPFADIVLFLNSETYEQHESVMSQLSEYWKNFVDSKIKSVIEVSKDTDTDTDTDTDADTPDTDADKVNANSSASCIQLLASVKGLDQPCLLIESIDKAKQKLIINHLIPYFSYRDLFQRESIDKIPKAFIKGALQKNRSKKP